MEAKTDRLTWLDALVLRVLHKKLEEIKDWPNFLESHDLRDAQKVVWHPDSPDGTVELRLAGVVVRQKVAAKSERCELSDVELPAGGTKLQAVQLLDGEERGVYQVIVTAR